MVNGHDASGPTSAAGSATPQGDDRPPTPRPQQTNRSPPARGTTERVALLAEVGPAAARSADRRTVRAPSRAVREDRVASPQPEDPTHPEAAPEAAAPRVGRRPSTAAAISDHVARRSPTGPSHPSPAEAIGLPPRVPVGADDPAPCAAGWRAPGAPSAWDPPSTRSRASAPWCAAADPGSHQPDGSRDGLHNERRGRPGWGHR